MAEITERQMNDTAQIALGAIFVAFFRLGITSFGGGTAAWLYRAIVQRQHWIDDQTYLAGVGLSRVMPGSSRRQSDGAGRANACAADGGP